MSEPETVELHGTNQGPEDVALAGTGSAYTFTASTKPRLVTAYDVARATSEAEHAFKFGLDPLKIAGFLRSLAEKLENRVSADSLNLPVVIPQEFDVLTTAESKDYAMTYLLFQFAETQPKT